MEVKIKKKLIEVALPLEEINTASVRENYIYKGNPSSLHKWWAQRPLSAARAVIFAQMVDDPSSYPDLFPTVKAQEKERKRLFKIIEKLVQWESTNDEEVLESAKAEIWRSWRRACAENADTPNAKELFDRNVLPSFYDPFAGGGTLPLEAQRLGFKSFATDLNPVAVLINKALIEFPPRFQKLSPINPESRNDKELFKKDWNGVEGLAEDIKYYGKWMKEEAERRIGNFYPKIEVNPEMAKDRPKLKPLIGQKLNVIAWLWVRTVKSSNPAFAKVEVPLAPTFMISTKSGKEVYVEPKIEGSQYKFVVKDGKPKNVDLIKTGTKLARGANFRCVMSGTPMESDYIKGEAVAGRMGLRLMAIVAESEIGRIYLPPTSEMENIANTAIPEWKPDVVISGSTQYLGVKSYGMEKFSDIFIPRQLVALSTLSDLIKDVFTRVQKDAQSTSLLNDSISLVNGGSGITAYAEAICLYLAFAIDKHAMYGNSLVPWYSKEDRPSMLFTQQALPMVWDPVELNPFSEVGGSFSKSLTIIASALEGLPKTKLSGTAAQQTATNQSTLSTAIISTDPPYYDNVPYADLSDFFYVWLRRSIKNIFPDLFSTLAVPKAEELVAFAYRHANKEGAEKFFLEGMTQAMHRLAEEAHPSFPITIYYAFKQSEKESETGTASTGWETFLEAVIHAGFAITGTWPMRTERTGRMRDFDSNALASSIVLVCRPNAKNAQSATRREFISVLKNELPVALTRLQNGNIAPVDLAQSAIGPGMGIFTRFTKVLDAGGKEMTVRQALALINEVLDEALANQEGDFDSDSRWALTWFEQFGFSENEYGEAEKLSKAKNTSVSGMVDAGILKSSKSKVRLLKPDELPTNWNPETDMRLTAWETVHQLIRVLEAEGERKAAELVKKLGSKAEVARELAYRLYAICEREKRPKEALSYNALVQSWTEINRLAQENIETTATQTDAFI